ncbi:GNAT family N-acetyltransferase [Paractinoplanes rishiriensis]|uniref:N-acetyltransferase n=1 Tax=Paractinoplanes rishiriensis TaxID=1050105 RepID=A0A919JZX8_9ACTN|nr:GNAT family N-acetyltransferase [Actinoplanes rishiriensis]GIE96153.1 N-acetyltransferase [Actinoplanes rishiriensis]
MAVIALRPVVDADLDALFDMMRDPEAVTMAAFTPQDPTDRASFDAKMSRIRTDPEITLRAITYDGRLAGSISAFRMEGDLELTYWVDRALWGRGIASQALTLFLKTVPIRPLHARAASDNLGSLRVLTKAGFQRQTTEIAYASARRTEIEETVLRLD